MSRTKGSALGVLLGWIVTIALVALLLEAVLRVCGVRPVVTINEPDRELGWVKRRDESTRKVTGEYDVTFAINSLGLRGDANLTREKPAGTQRVLFVGDSFVLGYTVEPRDHFVDLVGEALRADGRNVQALNGGTEGYSTDQEVLWLEKQGLSFQPDAVVFCFYENDVFGNGQRSFGGVPKPRFDTKGEVEPAPAVDPPRRGWMQTHTAIGTLPEVALALLAPKLPPDETPRLSAPPDEFAIPDCWARTSAGFARLAKDCANARTKLLFVAIPTREEVEPGALEAWCARTGVKASDVDPVTPTHKAVAAASALGVATLDPTEPMKLAAKDGTRLYFDRDWHVNPAGSRVLGRAIYDELCKPAFLGSAGSAKVAGAAVFTTTPTKPFPRWPIVLGVLWLLLSTLYAKSYRDEPAALAFVKVGAMLGAVVTIVWVFGKGVALLGPTYGRWFAIAVLAVFFGWLLWKMAPKVAVMKEVHGSFVRRGLWYMLPLIVVMLSIGGLLVVASSSPFIAPFIYTLF